MYNIDKYADSKKLSNYSRLAAAVSVKVSFQVNFSMTLSYSLLFLSSAFSVLLFGYALEAFVIARPLGFLSNLTKRRYKH